MSHFLTECLHIAMGAKGYEYPAGIWRRSLLSLPKPICGTVWALYGQYCILNGKHKELLEISERHPVLMYYKAYSLDICGNFSHALSYAQRFCLSAPEHREGAYLLSDILFELGRKNEAFQNSFIRRRQSSAG